MQRLRFDRIGAAVAALCLSGAIPHAQDIYAMVNAVHTDGAVVPGEVRVRMEEFGVVTGAKIPFGGGQFADLGPIRCAADTRQRRRFCSSRQPTDSTFSAGATTHRSRNGAARLDFDAMTTDTVISQTAIVRRSTDRSGHATDLTIRSTQRSGGLAYESTTMTLNGADTTYSAVHRTSGVTRFSGGMK